MVQKIALVFTLTLTTGCVSYVELAIRIQARSQKSDPLITYFDNRTGLRFTDRAGGLRRRVIFLNKRRLATYARRLYSGGRVTRGTPDGQAIEMHFLNYSTRKMRVDFRKFRIREIDTGRLHEPLGPRAYDERYAGHGRGGLPYFWAFEQKDSFTYHTRVPDWFGKTRQRRTGSANEFERQREENYIRIEAGHERRTRLKPGREIKGIAFFQLLPPDRDYVLEYAASTDTGGGFQFAPFYFRLNLVRGAKPSGASTRQRVYFAFESDRRKVQRDTGALLRMHEQLREHDRLRRRGDSN